MWQDPIIEELHAIRAAIAEQHGNDLHKIAEHFRAREAASTREKVSFPPKRPFGWTAPQTLGVSV
jgi:hypothetical protein